MDPPGQQAVLDDDGRLLLGDQRANLGARRLKGEMVSYQDTFTIRK
jgi:hypothetical protein